MKLKHRPNDFRVRELLADDVLNEGGAHDVYRVTKRKLTSLEAAEVLAELANVAAGDVAMAGLKDRQGVTEQFMSLSGGKRVSLDTPELKIAHAGTSAKALSAESSYGNAFEILLRELTPVELRRLAAHKDVVGRLGVPNYFDEQRFGNLKHGQGWVAKELMRGNHEEALRNLVCAESEFDAGKLGAFKRELRHAWRDWSTCRDVAGRFGEHHSVFDHLRRNPTDFAGAFFHISSRLRLIHLYAFQSHIWNRAVATYFARISGEEGARVGWTLEGPQVFPDRKLPIDLSWGGSFPLPGDALEGVQHPSQRELLEEALAGEGLRPEELRIEGVSGFQLKGEERRLFIRPRHLRIGVEGDRDERGGTARLSFELPRGAYATLVVRGLLARYERGPIELTALDPAPRAHRPQRSFSPQRDPWARARARREGRDGGRDHGRDHGQWGERREDRPERRRDDCGRRWEERPEKGRSSARRSAGSDRRPERADSESEDVRSKRWGGENVAPPELRGPQQGKGESPWSRGRRRGPRRRP